MFANTVSRANIQRYNRALWASWWRCATLL